MNNDKFVKPNYSVLCGGGKDIDAVMESQRDLVEPVLKIKQLVCVKGLSD